MRLEEPAVQYYGRSCYLVLNDACMSAMEAIQACTEWLVSEKKPGVPVGYLGLATEAMQTCN